jgi:hypothetical protein
VPAAPGFPEGISVAGNRVYVSGPARDATVATGPSKVLTCHWLYEDETPEWGDCQYHASLNYFGWRAICIQYSAN